jgi:hypothetical protein
MVRLKVCRKSCCVKIVFFRRFFEDFFHYKNGGPDFAKTILTQIIHLCQKIS